MDCWVHHDVFSRRSVPARAKFNATAAVAATDFPTFTESVAAGPTRQRCRPASFESSYQLVSPLHHKPVWGTAQRCHLSRQHAEPRRAGGAARIPIRQGGSHIDRRPAESQWGQSVISGNYTAAESGANGGKNFSPDR